MIGDRNIPPAIAEYVARQHRIQRAIRLTVIAIVSAVIGAKITYAHLHQHDWTCAFMTCVKATP